MKAYSVDLRQKIIEVHENENISIRKLAERFHVAKSFIQKLLKQYRETGDIAFLTLMRYIYLDQNVGDR